MESIDDFCCRFDNFYSLENFSYEVIKILDCFMNIIGIMRVLVISVLEWGVIFEIGVIIDKLLIDSYGKIKIKSFLCCI